MHVCMCYRVINVAYIKLKRKWFLSIQHFHLPGALVMFNRSVCRPSSWFNVCTTLNCLWEKQGTLSALEKVIFQQLRCVHSCIFQCIALGILEDKLDRDREIQLWVVSKRYYFSFKRRVLGQRSGRNQSSFNICGVLQRPYLMWNWEKP